jgi:hypothetical protein
LVYQRLSAFISGKVFSAASVKIAAAQKEVTVRALEFATRFKHLCAAIGAHPGHIGERRCSLWRWDAGDGFALFVHWAIVQFSPQAAQTHDQNRAATPGTLESSHPAAPLSTGLS